MVIPETRRAH